MLFHKLTTQQMALHYQKMGSCLLHAVIGIAKVLEIQEHYVITSDFRQIAV